MEMMNLIGEVLLVFFKNYFLFQYLIAVNGKILLFFFSLSSHGKFMLSMEMGLDIVVAPEFSIHSLPCLLACLACLLALPMLDVKDFNSLEKLLEDCNCAFFSTRMVLVYILLFLDIMFFV